MGLVRHHHGDGEYRTHRQCQDLVLGDVAERQSGSEDEGYGDHEIICPLVPADELHEDDDDCEIEGRVKYVVDRTLAEYLVSLDAQKNDACGAYDIHESHPRGLLQHPEAESRTLQNDICDYRDEEQGDLELLDAAREEEDRQDHEEQIRCEGRIDQGRGLMVGDLVDTLVEGLLYLLGRRPAQDAAIPVLSTLQINRYFIQMLHI